MKKKIFIAVCMIIVMGLAALGRAVTAPAKEVRACLEQLNGVRVGKTTEAELLSKPFFQTSERQCMNNVCGYRFVTGNKWLFRLHLAPETVIGVIVQAEDSVVSSVRVFGVISLKDLTASIRLDQVSSPSSCGPKPCILREYRPNQRYRLQSRSRVEVTFDGSSDIPDQFSTAVNAGCLSRLRGCSSVDELLPLASRLERSADPDP